MNDKLPQILITPEEAQIIELSLKGDAHTSMRYLLARVGACLVTNQSRVIAITDQELWFIRDHIDLDVSAGETMALHVIINIYKTLCKYYGITLDPVEFIPYEPEKLQIIVMEENNARRSSDETEDETRGSPAETATA